MAASGGLTAGRECLACGLGCLTVPWRPLPASELTAWRRLASSAGRLGLLGGLGGLDNLALEASPAHLLFFISRRTALILLISLME